MSLDSLKPADGTLKPRKRVGRGPGSGTGKTAARGHKGARSRSGYSRRRGFEGGQMPLIRRVPKRGFTNIFKKNVETVNVGELDRFAEGTIVTPELLVQNRLVRKSFDAIKVLGNGDLTKKLIVHAHGFSASAKAKVEASGGTVEELTA